MARLRSRIGTAPSTLTEPSGCGRTPGTGDVVLVGDVADDLLQDVLERDEPHHLAVFVDHQREVRLAAAERLELLGDRPDVGHEPGRQRDRHDVDLGEIAVRRSGSRAADPWRAGCRRCSPACRATAGCGCIRICSTASTIFSGGSSALTVTISVRWSMTSETSSSPKRKTFWMYSAWPSSILPCSADTSTSPSISTSVRISWCEPSLTPSMRRIERDAELSSQFSG